MQRPLRLTGPYCTATPLRRFREGDLEPLGTASRLSAGIGLLRAGEWPIDAGNAFRLPMTAELATDRRQIHGETVALCGVIARLLSVISFVRGTRCRKHITYFRRDSRAQNYSNRATVAYAGFNRRGCQNGFRP